MLFLLDTSVFIKLVNGEFNGLSQAQLSVLNDPQNAFCLSTASIFEMAIKVRKSQLEFADSFDSILDIIRKELKIRLLPVSQKDYRSIVDVQQVFIRNNRLHGDPFDLLIISQAINYQLPVLTTDEFFPYYADLTVIS